MINKPFDKQKATRKPAPTQEQEPVQPRSFLADLFKKPSDNDPVERQKARDALFGRTPNNTDPNGSFTK